MSYAPASATPVFSLCHVKSSVAMVAWQSCNHENHGASGHVGNRPRPQPLDQQQPRALTKIPRVKPDYELPRVLLSNTQGLTNKLDELTGVMELNNVDVAAITY